MDPTSSPSPSRISPTVFVQRQHDLQPTFASFFVSASLPADEETSPRRISRSISKWYTHKPGKTIRTFTFLPSSLMIISSIVMIPFSSTVCFGFGSLGSSEEQEQRARQNISVLQATCDSPNSSTSSAQDALHHPNMKLACEILARSIVICVRGRHFVLEKCFSNEESARLVLWSWSCKFLGSSHGPRRRRG